MAIVALLGVLLLGVLAWAAASRVAMPNWFAILGGRVAVVVDVAVAQLGRVVAASVVYLSGAAATLITCWALGKLAHALEPSVDVPLFHWFQARLHPGTWQQSWAVLTKLGNRPQTQFLTVLAAVLLAAAWSERRWWVPPAVLLSGYLMEKFGQTASGRLVNRGHPPTSHGTWPSGGCGRLIVVYGLIIALTLLWRGASRRAWVAAFSMLAFLATVEAYSRVYLLKHWFTDVIGGLVYGSLVLAVMVGVCLVLDRRSPAPGAAGAGATRTLQLQPPAVREPPASESVMEIKEGASLGADAASRDR